MLPHEQLTDRIIAAAIAVHGELGPRFLEPLYEQAMGVELGFAGLRYERQKAVPLTYRQRPIGEHRLDLLVEGLVVVELKAVTDLDPIFFATVRSYLKALNLDAGLLINFNSMPLTVKRVGRECFGPNSSNSSNSGTMES
jgi:GxxExxY protein